MSATLALWLLAGSIPGVVLVTWWLTKRAVLMRVATQLNEQRLSMGGRIIELETQLAGEQQRHADYRQGDEDRQKLLQAQFQDLANRIFDEKHSQFSRSSRESIDTSLRPLREQVDAFRKRIEEVHSTDLADRNRLKGQIEELQKQARQIGTDAVNLARALKGDSKMQGNWGEVVLERLLEQSGLRRGVEYELQVSMTAADGSRSIPDVVLRLPEGRSMIIDSKVSLSAYQDYVNEIDEDRRPDHLRRHIASLRAHFSGLSRKSYQDIEGLDTLDFVFMFIPVEPAWLLALKEDPSLFDDAFDKQVTLVSHTTLLPMLKTVQSLWRVRKQQDNVLEIARSAGSLHDKFVLMLESLDDLGRQLDRTQDAYQTTRARLGEGRGNLVNQVARLTELGAKASKQMPDSVKHLLDEAGMDKLPKAGDGDSKD